MPSGLRTPFPLKAVTMATEVTISLNDCEQTYITFIEWLFQLARIFYFQPTSQTLHLSQEMLSPHALQNELLSIV